MERAKTRKNISMKEETKKTSKKSINTSFDNYQKNKFSVDKTYDSSKMSTEQIAKDIIRKFLAIRKVKKAKQREQKKVKPNLYGQRQNLPKNY